MDNNLLEIAVTVLTAILGAGVSLWGTLWIYRRSRQIKRKQIKESLTDLFRHFWRNRVILISIKELMENDPDYRDRRPSELHFLKLKDLDVDSNILFDIESYGSIKRYAPFHELQLKIRNFHIEVDAAVKYLTDDNYDRQTMISSHIDNLIFKQGYLTQEIAETMREAFPKNQNNIDEMYAYMMQHRHPDPRKRENLYDMPEYAPAFKEDVNAELARKEQKFVFGKAEKQ